MPANLTPQYLEADKRFREAKDLEEKISALRDMMALIPKHKGTDKLRADLRRKLSKLLEEPHKRPKKGGRAYDHIPREGIAQIALLGLPNSGKSSFINYVTKARTQVADYPFSTTTPAIGMLDYEDVQIQIIDLPPLWEKTESWVYNIVRNCDLAIIILDSTSISPGEDYLAISDYLLKAKIALSPVKIGEDEMQSIRTVPAIIVLSKCDFPEDTGKAGELKDLLGDNWVVTLFSIINPHNLDLLKREIFINLNLIRVYTKKPGYPPDLDRPYVLPKGSTLQDVASAIHKDLSKAFKFARVWSKDGSLKGMAAEKNYLVKDSDILEFHR
ncbi:MAG: GTPase Obg [candidate division WS2 bacterium]|nr:GTPase Obg [Candidatus Lithacetigena glycinireducens]